MSSPTNGFIDACRMTSQVGIHDTRTYICTKQSSLVLTNHILRTLRQGPRKMNEKVWPVMIETKVQQCFFWVCQHLCLMLDRILRAWVIPVLGISVPGGILLLYSRCCLCRGAGSLFMSSLKSFRISDVNVDCGWLCWNSRREVFYFPYLQIQINMNCSIYECCSEHVGRRRPQ